MPVAPGLRPSAAQPKSSTRISCQSSLHCYLGTHYCAIGVIGTCPFGARLPRSSGRWYRVSLRGKETKLRRSKLLGSGANPIGERGKIPAPQDLLAAVNG